MQTSCFPAKDRRDAKPQEVISPDHPNGSLWPDKMFPECSSWAKVDTPEWCQPFLGTQGLEPELQRAFDLRFGDKLNASDLAGIDLYQANRFLVFRAETAEFLNSEYTPLSLVWPDDYLPLVRKTAMQSSVGLRSSLEKAIDLLPSRRPLLHPCILPWGVRLAETATWMQVPYCSMETAGATSRPGFLCSYPLADYSRRNFPERTEYADPAYWNRIRVDTVTTCIRTEKGIFIDLRFDSVAPRPHNMSGCELQGRRAAFCKPDGIKGNNAPLIWIDGRSPTSPTRVPLEWEPLAKYREEYDHP